MKKKLTRIYQRLDLAFGNQRWWPAESALEMIVGAILTQNTTWANVEKAIALLKKNNVLQVKKLWAITPQKLAVLIKSAGYYNIKASRIKNFLKFFLDNFNGNVKLMQAQKLANLRLQLLAVNGVGEETADSILLYALNKPIFVVDSYTKRILLRHGLIKAASDYAFVQNIFMRHLKPDVKLFGQYHALLVKLGKDYCHKLKPQCEICPLYGQ